MHLHTIRNEFFKITNHCFSTRFKVNTEEGNKVKTVLRHSFLLRFHNCITIISMRNLSNYIPPYYSPFLQCLSRTRSVGRVWGYKSPFQGFAVQNPPFPKPSTPTLGIWNLVFGAWIYSLGTQSTLGTSSTLGT